VRSEVLISKGAYADIELINHWYSEVRPELAELFRQDLRVSLELISFFPESGIKFRKNYRTAYLSAFPYGIYYVVKGKDVIVLSVTHNRKHPSKKIKRKQ